MIRLQSVARRSVTNVLNLLSGRLHRQKRSTEDTTVLPSMSLPEVIKIYLYINIFLVIQIHLWHILSHYICFCTSNNSYKSVLVIFPQIPVFALIYPYFITIQRYCILKINRWSLVKICFFICSWFVIYGVFKLARSRCGRDHMVVGITTTYAFSDYHN
jgi:hypothetical protein